jgi:Tfp pilus assembly protein PilO
VQQEKQPVGNQRAPLFAIIGGVVLAVMLVVFLVLPEMGKVSKAKEDLAQAQQQEQTLTVQRNALEDTRANAAENRRIIEQVHQQIPPTVDEGGLFNLINKAALDSGFPIVNISPSTPTFDDSTGLSTIVLTVSAVGTYSAVTAFTYRIETLPRAAKITALSLSPSAAPTSTSTSPPLTMTATIEAYTSDTSAGPGSDPGPTEAG